MKDLIVTSGIVGALLPALIALINQVHWPSWLKAVSAFILCILAAVVTLWVQDALDFTAENFLVTLMAIFTLARTTYAGLWKPALGVEKLEEKTTVTSPPPP